MAVHRTGYCTPIDVFEILGMLDDITGEPIIPQYDTYPNYMQLERRIIGFSDEFDARTHDSWRINHVVDHIFDRGSEWKYNNTYLYGSPSSRGGWHTQLMSPILPWNPDKGDKLEMLSFGTNGKYQDISNEEGLFWFDYEAGIFYYLGADPRIQNLFRITYRWGRDNEQPPYDIQDAVAKMTAIWVMQTDWYRTKIAGGGDLSSKTDTIRMWREDINQIIYNHLNCGSAISMLP